MKTKTVFWYLLSTLLLMGPALAFGQDPAPIDGEEVGGVFVKLLDYATNIIGTASVIAAVIPKNKSSIALVIAQKLLDFLAFNFGYVKADKMKGGRREYDDQ